MNCTCGPSHEDLCPFCEEMLWAAELEHKLDNVRFSMASLRTDAITAETLEGEIEMALSNAEVATKEDLRDYTSESDVEKMIESGLDEMDLSEHLGDLVTKDELPEEIRSALEDVDIVQNVAAGAAEGAMRQIDRYKDAVHDLSREVAALKAMVDAQNQVLRSMTFSQRLRMLFSGIKAGL